MEKNAYDVYWRNLASKTGLKSNNKGAKDDLFSNLIGGLKTDKPSLLNTLAFTTEQKFKHGEFSKGLNSKQIEAAPKWSGNTERIKIGRVTKGLRTYASRRNSLISSGGRRNREEVKKRLLAVENPASSGYFDQGELKFRPDFLLARHELNDHLFSGSRIGLSLSDALYSGLGEERKAAQQKRVDKFKTRNDLNVLLPDTSALRKLPLIGSALSSNFPKATSFLKSFSPFSALEQAANLSGLTKKETKKEKRKEFKGKDKETQARILKFRERQRLKD